MNLAAVDVTGKEYQASLETLREGWARALMSEPEDLPGGPQGSCGVQRALQKRSLRCARVTSLRLRNRAAFFVRVRPGQATLKKLFRRHLQ